MFSSHQKSGHVLAMCSAGEFPCIISEQCIASGARCNGVMECADKTDEMNCEG